MAFEGMNDIQQSDCERTRGSQARSAGRDIGYGGNFDVAVDRFHLQHVTHDGMFDLVEVIDLFGPRVAEADAIVELLVDRDVKQTV